MSPPSVQQLIDAVGTGRPIDLSATRSSSAANRLPAELLREALLDPSIRADPKGLTLIGATVAGLLDLSYAKLTFPLNFLHCSFEQTPRFQHFCGTHLAFTGCDAPGVVLDSAILEGRLSLDHGFQSDGCVSASGATIRDSLSCAGAALRNEGDVALRLVDARIGGQLNCAEGFSCVGEVVAVGMRVAGIASFEGASIVNPGQVALGFDRASFSQLLNLSTLTCDGQIRGLGMQVSGQLSLRGAQIRLPGDSAGLIIESVSVGDNVLLDEGFECAGGVEAGRLTTPAHVQIQGNTPNLNLQMAQIGALHVDLRSFDVLDLTYATVRTLSAERQPFVQTHSLALTSPDDSPPVEMAVALVALGSQTKFKPGAWPYGQLRCVGWEVQDLHGDLQDRDFIAAWIASGDDASQQPWHEVANAYERQGRLSDATWLRWRAARRATKEMDPLPKTIRLFYSAFAGYGYYPLLAVLWILAATLAAGMLLTMAGPDAWIGASNQSAAQAWIYAMAVVLPSATVAGVEDVTVNAPWLIWALNALRTFGWIQTAILLAGVTGLLRRS